MRPMGCQNHCQILTKLSLPSADAHKELLQIVQDMPRRNMAEHGGTWRNGDRWDRSGPAIFVSFTLRMFQGPFDSKMRCLGRWFWNNDNDHACGDENGFNPQISKLVRLIIGLIIWLVVSNIFYFP